MALVVGLSCFYLLTTSRERPWSDGQFVYATASALVERGELHLPMAAEPGRKGLPHSPHPLLTSLVHVPGAALEALARPLWPRGQLRMQVFASHLAPALLGALCCLLFARTLRALGLSRLTERLSTLMLGLATVIWVYARSSWPPIVETVAFTGFFAALLRVAREPDRRACTVLAVWFTVLLAARPAFLVALPGVVLFVMWRRWRTGASAYWLWRRAAPGAIAGLVVASLDSYLRLGSFTTWLSRLVAGPFEPDLLMGLWAVFLSPGKSFFLYSPPLVLLPFAFRVLAARGLSWVSWAMLATLGPIFVHLALSPAWVGDWAWGPRFLVFATPTLLLPVAVMLDEWLCTRRWLPICALATLVLVGVGVQVLGNGLYWDHYVRFAKGVRGHWLGAPDRRAAFFPTRDHGCDPCFEDGHVNTWLPPFQPIEGHYWMLGHVVRGHDWKQAEEDATWHRYTFLSFPLAAEYDRARVDWWFLNFHPRGLGKGIFYLLLATTFSGLGFVVWWREHAALSREGAGQAGDARP